MRVGDSYIEGAAGGRSRACWGRARVRLTRLLIVLVAVTGLGGVMAVGALANSYTGLLYAGTLNITSNGSSESGGYIYGDDSWTAPTGTLFAGFAYTSGAFSAKSDNSVGGVSAGFGGDGSANQPSILFPWTGDCSITNSLHEWTYDGATAGTSGQQSCNTTGNTSGWNYTNAEVESTVHRGSQSADRLSDAVTLSVFVPARDAHATMTRATAGRRLGQRHEPLR